MFLTADPEIPVPHVRYGGIERIVDTLAREFRPDVLHSFVRLAYLLLLPL